jgi:hypothetical protein
MISIVLNLVTAREDAMEPCRGAYHPLDSSAAASFIHRESTMSLIIGLNCPSGRGTNILPQLSGLQWLDADAGLFLGTI